jgi:protein-S-isoprenylcysteine O-methyltransferase Ste14
LNGQLVTAVAVAAIVAYGIAAYSIRARARRSRPPTIVEAGGLARNSPYFVWVPYLVITLRPGPEIDIPEPMRWLGLALVVGGVALSIWSAATLGRHFDVELEVHGGHEVVRRGPYSLVRHPIYTGLAVHFIGACLATGNLILVAGTLLVSFPALYQRAASEETLLRRELGDAYESYAREVPMLVPMRR